jgi:hypothetical protein
VMVLAMIQMMRLPCERSEMVQRTWWRIVRKNAPVGVAEQSPSSVETMPEKRRSDGEMGGCK